MYRKKTNKSLDILRDYWLHILIGLVVLPFAFRLILNRKAIITNAEQKAEIKYLETIQDNVQLQDEYMKEHTTHQQRLIAREIYHHLGYAYAWYDPRRWTENDKEIYLLLKDFAPIPKGIEIAYYTISAGRNLKNDLLRLLDRQYYNKLKW